MLKMCGSRSSVPRYIEKTHEKIILVIIASEKEKRDIKHFKLSMPKILNLDVASHHGVRVNGKPLVGINGNQNIAFKMNESEHCRLSYEHRGCRHPFKNLQYSSEACKLPMFVYILSCSKRVLRSHKMSGGTMSSNKVRSSTACTQQ